MDSALLLSFLALDLLLVCVPGADWAYAIAAGLRERSVTWAVGGLVAGYALHTLLAAAGLAVLVAGSPGLLTVLTVAGAAYLVWLGWGVLRRPGTPGAAREEGPAGAEGSATAEGGSRARVFLRGATISGLNPKGLLLYLSVLPQFLVTRGAHLPVPVQTVVLGLLHMACCAAVYLTVGLAARAVLGARPAAARAVTRTSGAAMLGIGAFLLVQRLALS
ncbi:LysE family translocator [Streptomyces sp. NPDC057376]|uniref:LysE family translocator n=1 Tax=unclassified Streptomyces TaxID=2593676 RepID=UPI00093D5E57|nr:LysE family translocator [Streptomyces sp. CB02414]OKI84788.1 lysine transporter LysE [Streptomyces sp. CB02414]